MEDERTENTITLVLRDLTDLQLANLWLMLPVSCSAAPVVWGALVARVGEGMAEELTSGDDDELGDI